ncbi:MAG: hypothetical protein R3A79_24460 [Nannocystaceae bacterium]
MELSADLPALALVALAVALGIALRRAVDRLRAPTPQAATPRGLLTVAVGDRLLLRDGDEVEVVRVGLRFARLRPAGGPEFELRRCALAEAVALRSPADGRPWIWLPVDRPDLDDARLGALWRRVCAAADARGGLRCVSAGVRRIDPATGRRALVVEVDDRARLAALREALAAGLYAELDGPPRRRVSGSSRP